MLATLLYPVKLHTIPRVGPRKKALNLKRPPPAFKLWILDGHFRLALDFSLQDHQGAQRYPTLISRSTATLAILWIVYLSESEPDVSS